MAYCLGSARNGNVRIGLYELGSTGWPDLPDGGALLVESASTAQAGLGANNELHWITVADTQLSPGTYFGALQGDDATGTWRAEISNYAVWEHNVDGSVTPSRRYALVYGAFTDPCPATLADFFPVFWLRVKSVP